MPTNILVVGGAGFIGSHMVDILQRAGYTPVVLDNLSTGHAPAVLEAELVVGEMNDEHVLDSLFSQHDFAAVMHFASFIEVGESVQDPAKYYVNNVGATIKLLNMMQKWHVKRFIFSSTAAVYGEPKYTPIDERHPIAPINPYGHTKSMVEQILKDFAAAYDFSYTVLRYFNAAGADPQGRLGEWHQPETHLIPLVLQTALGMRPSISVFGRDYPTADGTCVRDYVHVTDICVAHLLALQSLFEGKKTGVYNLGTGHGFSVQQVIDLAQTISEQEIVVINGERRPGDPAILVADATRAMQELNWQPQYSDLQTIIQHAWEYMQSKVQ